MKLYELINFDPIKSTTNNIVYNNRLRTDLKSKTLGSGSFGIVHDVGSGKRLNQVTKIGKGETINSEPAKDVENDGYLSYLRAVYDSGSSNPYFPRIHDLKIMRSKTEALTYRVNLEKLVEFNSDKIIGNEDLMQSIYEDMFGDTRIRFGDSITSAIKSNLEGALMGKFESIKDPELLSALKLIYRVLKSNPGFVADIHSGNIMWRITGTRPQLVIVDPIA